MIYIGCTPVFDEERKSYLDSLSDEDRENLNLSIVIEVTKFGCSYNVQELNDPEKPFTFFKKLVLGRNPTENDLYDFLKQVYVARFSILQLLTKAAQCATLR